MAKYLTLANGSMLVGIDQVGHVRDIYYPYVGLENHVSSAGGSFVHRVGVWIDGRLSWLDDPSWDVGVAVAEGTMSGVTTAINRELEVTLRLCDVVAHDKNIFTRLVTVKNTASKKRTIKLYFAQQFRIAEDRSGATGFYDPRVQALIHYKGRINFLVNAMWGTKGFDDYSLGLFNMESRDGTYQDAQDGVLAKNPIEHGSVDSVIGFSLVLEAETQTDVTYWVAVGETVHAVHALNAYMKKKGSRSVVRSTTQYWKAWLRSSDRKRLHILDPELVHLYRESLLVMRAHTDRRGGIIASSDSDILNYGRDTYSYVWPRDAAISACAFDVAGYHDLSRSLFTFIGSLLEPGGYLMQKYRPDGALGSSWLPWMREGKPDLPIQEDETATMLYALWQHFLYTRDTSFMKSAYHTMVMPMANFISAKIHKATALPMESYDLWEETFGTSTYTSASVYGGLCAAAACAKLFGTRAQEQIYRTSASTLKHAISTHLFNEETGTFLKYVRSVEGGLERDTTLDISGFHGPLVFGVFPVTDPRITRMFAAVERDLKVQTSIGGYIRYSGDRYYRVGDQDPSNPWFVTTLWIARYHIKKAQTRGDLAPALELLEWAEHHALPTYMFPEQIHPYTGAPLSATPLVWSHAEYVLAVNEYLDAYERLPKG